MDNGIVTVIPFPGDKMQVPSYNHAIENYQDETKYMAFIDGDEFLLTTNGESINAFVESMFIRYADWDYLYGREMGGIGVNWRVYGTGCHETNNGKPCVERFLYRASDFNNINFHIKTICDPRKVERFSNPHYAYYKKGYVCISENGSVIDGPFFPDGRCEKIRINHYVYKSREEYKDKIWRGRSDMIVGEKEKEKSYNENMLLEDVFNTVYDPIALRYIDKVN